MIDTHLTVLDSNLHKVVLPSLEARVFHVTRLDNLDGILKAGKILPNTDGVAKTTFGSASNSFFRNRGCVSLFDYRTATPEQIDTSLGKCSPVQPLYSSSENVGIAILLLAPETCPQLIPWTLWKDEEAWREMVVPYVEAGHRGPVPLSLVDEILRVQVEPTPGDNDGSIVTALRRGRARRAPKG